jgi:hypothetical protein
MVHAGDFDKDGKLDLVAVNGSDQTLILLQNPSDRAGWSPITLGVGTGSYFVRTGDFDGDQLDDLLVADPATTAYFVRNLGEGKFGSPSALPKTKASRWVTVGDWNNDGSLDVASANHDLSTLTVLTGDGKGNFTVTQNPLNDDTHAIEALDYDADGKPDLALGVGTFGLVLLHGLGDGNFGQPRELGIRCVRYMATGDLNKDGRGDLAVTCDTMREMATVVSQANGSYKTTRKAQLPEGNETPGIGDLNGDGDEDVAVSEARSQSLAVYLGKGDGAFLPAPRLFGPLGKSPSFFITRDLDGDARKDAVSADTGSSSLSLFWGQEGDRFLEAGEVAANFGPARAFALADLDGNGLLDLFLPNPPGGEVRVALNPGEVWEKRKTASIRANSSPRGLAAVDLDGDGTPDLAAATQTSSVVVSLLGADGSAHGEIQLEAGLIPADIQAGMLDGGDTLDLAVPCTGSNHVAVFLGRGEGKFGEALIVPTVEAPQEMALGDLDGDRSTDLVVVSSNAVALHYGKGDESFSEKEVVSESTVNFFAGAAAADIDGDGTVDLVILSKAGVSILAGKGARQFENAVSLEAGIEDARSLLLHDLDGDGWLDITLSSRNSHALSILYNHGAGSFSPARTLGVGPVDLGHRLADMDQDGAVDLVAFSSTSATVFFGLTPARRFRRGDADGNGKLAITDAIFVLNWLFRGASPPSCEDAADADDNGAVNLTDPIRTLRRLFQGDGPLPPPGSDSCGEDPTVDELPKCVGACQAEQGAAPP